MLLDVSPRWGWDRRILVSAFYEFLDRLSSLFLAFQGAAVSILFLLVIDPLSLQAIASIVMLVRSLQLRNAS